MLEYHIKSIAPDIFLRCGDFASVSLTRLRSLFTECDSIESMDLRDPTWATDPHDVLLLNRVDTELSDTEWANLFRQLHAQQVDRIVFVPGGLLTASLAVREFWGLVAAVGRHHRLARAGYLRSEARMQQLFRDFYVRSESRPCGGLPMWVLARSPDAGSTR